MAASQGLPTPQLATNHSVMKGNREIATMNTTNNNNSNNISTGTSLPGGPGTSGNMPYLNQSQLDIETQSFIEANIDRTGKKVSNDWLAFFSIHI